MTEVHTLPGRWESATEIVRRFKAKEQSAVEVVTDAFKRIDQLNTRYGAVTFADREGVLESARGLDRKLATDQKLGPLAGIPTLMKDLYGFRPGWPTTLGGFPAARHDIAPADLWSRYPLQVTRNDGLLLGQPNSSTFGFCGATDNAIFGPSRNPFNPSRNSGGSSGGSAVAVATGMVPVAGASDAGGSIRIPAAWTNTVGFQPSAGRVPSTPRPALFHLGPHLYEGPVARTVEDAILVMNALQGFDPHDPYSTPSAPFPADLLDRGIGGLRIGLSLDFGGFPVNPRVREAILNAVSAFEELGATVEPVALNLIFSHQEHTEMWLRSMGLLMLADLENFAARGIQLASHDLPEHVHFWTEKAKLMSARDVSHDRVMRTSILDGILDVQEKYDLIVGPTVVDLPVLNQVDGKTVGPDVVDGVKIDPLIGWCPTYLTNFSGSPSISVPAGLVDGLPVGLLIVGRKYEDASVFAAAAAFEQARPWMQNYSLVE